MFFLLRTAFWFSLVLLALPLGSPEGGNGRSVGPLDALAAARDAVSDLAGLCERQPDVCETGRGAVEVIGVRAREGSRLAFEALDGRFGPEAGAARPMADAAGSPQDAITTGAVPLSDGAAPTLTLPDHAPLPG